MKSPKLIRITTIPMSLRILLTDQLAFMSRQGFEVVAVSSSGSFLDEVAEIDQVPTVAIEMSRQITPVKDLVALWQLIRLFRKEKPDIVHTHTPKAGLLGMLAARIAGVPHRLHTVAGLPLTEATGVKRKLLNLTEKLTYACATKVYPNSLGLQDIILENRFTSPEKLRIIGRGSSNGIDTSFFDPERVSAATVAAYRERLGIAPSDFVYLFVGRVVADKGINELVTAFCALAETESRMHLVVVGPFEPELDAVDASTEAAMASHPRIHSVGYQTQVIDYFAMADVLVFPSYREGFPNVVLQAGAMQRNCIVSDINGCNEIVTDGENGWIVPSKDVARLQERMQWCFAHEAESRAMGLRGREAIQEKYERRYVWNELLKEYREILLNGD